MTDDTLGDRLIAATDSCLKRALPLVRQAGRRLPPLSVRLDLTGQAAGQLRRYRDGRLVIRYNLAMAATQPDAFIAETVPHEVAHAITQVCHGRVKPHGREWQQVMRWLGVAEPRRCHDFTPPAGRRGQRRWTYRCGCGEQALSTTRHNRVLRGISYMCRRCGQALTRA